MKMKKPKYRARAIDIPNDIWVMEKRAFLIWKNVGAGPRVRIEALVKEWNAKTS